MVSRKKVYRSYREENLMYASAELDHLIITPGKEFYSFLEEE